LNTFILSILYGKPTKNLTIAEQTDSDQIINKLLNDLTNFTAIKNQQLKKLKYGITLCRTIQD